MYNEPTLSVCGVFLVALNYNGVASDVTQISAVEERLIICCVCTWRFLQEKCIIFTLYVKILNFLLYTIAIYMHVRMHVRMHVCM